MKVLWQIVNSLAKSRVGVRSGTRLWVSAANADGNDGVLIRTLEVSTAARDLDLLRAVSDYVAVLAVREAGVELLAEIAESEEANVSSRKSKSCARGVPIGDRLTNNFVRKLGHVHDAAPPVLTSPPVPASIWEGSRRSTRWALVGVLEVVGGHDSLEAVVVAKHEGYSHLVLPVVVESRVAFNLVGSSQNSSAASVTSLVVMVVHKDNRVHAVNHSPSLVVDAPQAVEVVAADALSHLQPISELGDFSDTEVFVGRDGFSAHIDHLVEEQRPATTIDILSHSLDGVQVSWPHMFARVHSEATHPNVDHIIVVSRDLLSHILFSSIQVVKTH